MKISCRNQFAGQIAAINKGAVNSEVALTINEQVQITAVITNQSIERLELAEGKDALALIKASDVMIATDALRMSARNVFTGTVAKVVSGEVNDEVTVTIGDCEFVAIITKASSQSLSLTAGQAATVVVKASSVILAA
ncbi:TOBE domain-containing protein [Ferrimonas senticii]|uniref:TOBE domain-containing protein n=1 Tax=Ferrimonas senticii TaxID=394566 RepID=UPI00041D67ED|nr:TOBE domain-containing protein [Ferrimonas senticii]